MYKYYLPTAIKVATSDNPDMIKLSELMSEISELLFYASWIYKNENLVWEIVEGEFKPDREISAEYIETIKDLRERLDGWIVLLDDSLYSRTELPVSEWGLYFVSMKEWMKGIKNIEL